MTRLFLTAMMTTTLVLSGCYVDGELADDELADGDEGFDDEGLFDDDELGESEDELYGKVGSTTGYTCTGGATSTTCTCDPMQGDVTHADTCKGMMDHCHSKGATVECTWITTSNGSCSCSYTKSSWGAGTVKVATPVKVKGP